MRRRLILKPRRRRLADSKRLVLPDSIGVNLEPPETYTRRETEREVAERLAALESSDPSQKRPTPKHSVFERVDYFDL